MVGEQLDGDAKGLDALIHFPINLGDSSVDGVDLLKMQPRRKTVVLHDIGRLGLRAVGPNRQRFDAIISERSQLARSASKR